MFERDQNLQIERYTRKLGSQFVSSILRGNGAVVLEGAPSAELSFICLLADDKRAVFFEWLPRANVAAFTQCTRDGALRDKPRPCLELLLQVAESDLTQAYAIRFQEARERDHDAGNENTVTSFRKSNDEWRQYRDAECARRLDQRAQGGRARRPSPVVHGRAHAPARAGHEVTDVSRALSRLRPRLRRDHPDPGADGDGDHRQQPGHGARAGLLNVAGTQLGLALMMPILVVGLTSVIAAMGWLFEWLRWAGAAYLVWLGWKLLRSPDMITAEEERGTCRAAASSCRASWC